MHQPLPRQAARPAAAGGRAADRILAARRGHPVRRGDAAGRQRLGRRPARPHPEVQGLGDRPERLHLLHHPGRGLGEGLRRHRQARVEDRSRLRHAEGAAAAAERDLRHDRGLDDDQGPSSRSWTSATRSTSRSGRSCQHEGDRRGRGAAGDRHHRRGRPPRARPVSQRRPADQDVGQPGRGEALAAARRAHDGDPRARPRLLRRRSRRGSSARARSARSGRSPPSRPGGKSRARRSARKAPGRRACGS